MTRLIAVDPGRSTGLAVFDDRALTCARKTDVSDMFWPGLFAVANELVIEYPQIYQSKSQWKGDPNDLIKVAIEVGQWKERARLSNVLCYMTLPAAWKGQVPKPIHHKRALAKLSPAELAILPPCKVSKENPHGFDNNMLDAVALGLWRLGRL